MIFSNKKINYFIILTFIISWLSIVIINLLGYTYGSMEFTVTTAFLFMCAPAISVFIVKKIVFRENLNEYGLQFKILDYRWIIHSAIATIFFIFLTIATIYLFGNIFKLSNFGFVDISQNGLDKALNKLAGDKEYNVQALPEPLILLVLSTIGGVVSGAFINLPFTFGEELGWRGLLHKETQHLGFIKSTIFIGIIWGIWHAPVILMGHNYNNNSIMGVFMMIAFCVVLSFPMSYIRIKTKNIIGPSMLHGMINGSANVLSIFIHDGNLLFNGPAGIAGILVISIFTLGIFIFDKSFVKNYSEIIDKFDE